ncbi:molybdate ABC transporter substrate-binding protein [Marivita sp. S2033]|uniref:molybdate ABC transporter substrate-binding protein n=1 Tax=Marivita sp. S2033 TaxID=3373187 RepID=UPI0039821CAD
MFPLLRAALVALCVAAPVHADEITVFAAASLGDALGEASEMWMDETGHHVTLALAGSSTLARQIDAGAPADVFLSANADWMTWLVEHDRVLPDTRRDIASNRLVLIAHDGAARSEAEMSSDTDVLGLLGQEGRLAIALPEAVPAGIYAKAALSGLGLWAGLEQRLAPTDNVRAALALVALGEAPAGVVYATDAKAETKVHVAGVFPEGSHPPIRYPAAVVTGSPHTEVAAAFLDWLETGAAQKILAAHGFMPPLESE